MKRSVACAALFCAAAQALTVPKSASASGFKWLGVSESVAEFGKGSYPGLYGKDYYFPDTSTITVCTSMI